MSVVTIPRELAELYMPADALARAEADWQQTAEEAVKALYALRREYESLSLSQDRQANYQASWALREAYKANAHDHATAALAVNAASGRLAEVLGVQP